jgi:hypothetical protein
MNKNSPKKAYIIIFSKLNILFFFVLININFLNKNKTMTSICLNKIFIYDNNDLNGENLEDILSKYIKYNFVEIINYRGKYKPQKQAYNNCYINNNKDYNWMAFYDADEYLYKQIFVITSI